MWLAVGELQTASKDGQPNAALYENAATNADVTFEDTLSDEHETTEDKDGPVVVLPPLFVYQTATSTGEEPGEGVEQTRHTFLTLEAALQWAERENGERWELRDGDGPAPVLEWEKWGDEDEGPVWSTTFQVPGQDEDVCEAVVVHRTRLQ